MIDLEEECCSLTRATLKNPVIGKVGYEWICMDGGYFTPLENLKGTWCGESLLDAFVCWCEMMGSKEWVVYDRLTEKPYSFEDSEIFKFYKNSVEVFQSEQREWGEIELEEDEEED
jgi:hypothetical protein